MLTGEQKLVGGLESEGSFSFLGSSHCLNDYKIDKEVRDRKHDIDDWVNVV